MAHTAHTPATYADLEALPPRLVGEILFGRLVTQPRPTRRHGGATSVLGMVVGPPYQLGLGGPGDWIFVDVPELHLGPHVVVPDIAGWRRERMTEPADQPWFGVAPDWLCESLSKRTERHDRGEKRRIYGLYGVGYLWYLDPRVRMLEVFRRQAEDWLLLDTLFENDEVNTTPFDQLTFSLGLLWPFDKLSALPAEQD